MYKLTVSSISHGAVEELTFIVCDLTTCENMAESWAARAFSATIEVTDRPTLSAGALRYMDMNGAINITNWSKQ